VTKAGKFEVIQAAFLEISDDREEIDLIQRKPCKYMQGACKELSGYLRENKVHMSVIVRNGETDAIFTPFSRYFENPRLAVEYFEAI
jgi:hypothetical protein